MKSERANRIPLLSPELLLSESLFKYHGTSEEQRKFELTNSLTYLNSLVNVSQKAGHNRILQNVPVIHYYDFYSLECNAICLESETDVEIGFSSGLREVIFATSQFVSTEPKLFSEIRTREIRRVVNYSDLPEPLGFQDICVNENNSFKYAFNKSYGKIFWNNLQTVDRLRLGIGLAFRITCELFVWFHEYFHHARHHLKLINKLGEKKLAMAELNNNINSSSNLIILRALEHDADRMALINLIANFQTKTNYSNIFKLFNQTDGYRLMFFSILCTITLLGIGEILNGSTPDQTHPNMVSRITYLSVFVELAYPNSEIAECFNKAVNDWGFAYTHFGWQKFIDSHCIIPNPTDKEIGNYYNQVYELLKPIDNFFSSK